MVPASSRLLLLVSSACCLILTPVNGRVLTDEDADTDAKWPVLCPPNTFYSLEEDQCMNCSQCPMNKIIISLCHEFDDTKCGPFYDFRSELPEEPAGTKDKSQNTRANSHESRKQTNHNKPETQDSNDESSDSLHTTSDNAVFSDSEWKSLTIALIVLVSVVFVLVVSFVSYFLRKSFMNKTKIVCEYSFPPENV